MGKTPEDRAEQARELWTIHGWDQHAIARHLGVNQSTVSRDVVGYRQGRPLHDVIVPERYRDNPWPWAVTEGRRRVRDIETSQWELGDLACIAVEVGPPGVRTDTQGNVEAYAAALGLEYEALNAYRKLANRYPPGTRVPGASWSAHRAAIGAADPVTLLKTLAAEAGGDVVTVKAVRQAVRMEKLEHAIAVAKRRRGDAVEGDFPDLVGWTNTADDLRQQVNALARDIDAAETLWQLNPTQRETLIRAFWALQAEVGEIPPKFSDEAAAAALAAWKEAHYEGAGDAEHEDDETDD